MHRRHFIIGLLGLGAASAVVGPQAAHAAMPVAPPPSPEPSATTAEVQPGRDEMPEAQQAQVYIVRRRYVRRVYYRRPIYRRRVYYRRPVYVRRVYYRRRYW